jgi:hypothetical protein
MKQANNQIEFVPPGIRYNFIGIALTKRALQSAGLKTGDKLHLLERLNECGDPEILAMIDPMTDIEFQIFREAKSLDVEGGNLSPAQKTQASFDILTSGKVFSHFVTLNAGMAKAIRWHEERPRSAPIQRAPVALPSVDQTSVDAPTKYHVSNVPSQTAGPASIWPAVNRTRTDH